MPNKPPRRSSPSRTKLTTRVLRRKAKRLKTHAKLKRDIVSLRATIDRKRKGKSRTDATPPPAQGARKSLGPAVLELYHKGKSVSEISSALSTSPNRVYIHLKRAGLPSPTKRGKDTKGWDIHSALKINS